MPLFNLRVETCPTVSLFYSPLSIYHNTQPFVAHKHLRFRLLCSQVCVGWMRPCLGHVRFWSFGPGLERKRIAGVGRMSSSWEAWEIGVETVSKIKNASLHQCNNCNLGGLREGTRRKVWRGQARDVPLGITHSTNRKPGVSPLLRSIGTGGRVISHHSAKGTSCVPGATKNTGYITPQKSHHEHRFLQ